MNFKKNKNLNLTHEQILRKLRNDANNKFRKSNQNGGFLKKNPTKKILIKSKVDIKRRVKIKYSLYSYGENYMMNEKSKDILKYFVGDEQGEIYCRNKITSEYVIKSFMDPNIIGIVAELGGEYIGFILFNQLSKKELYLKLLCSISSIDLPEKKNIPVGKLLLNQMEKYAKEKKIKKISLNAVKEAIPFYENNSYRKAWTFRKNKSIRMIKSL